MTIMARHRARDMTVGRLERSPIHLLHRAGQCASDIFQGEMGEEDLTPTMFFITWSVWTRHDFAAPCTQVISLFLK